MKRDMALAREILLAVEARADGGGTPVYDFAIEARSAREVSYHVWLLSDGGYVESRELPYEENGVPYVANIPIRLTWRGQEFLEAVRDSDVWKSSLEAAKQGGTASIEFVWDLARAYLRKKIAEKVGVDLG